MAEKIRDYYTKAEEIGGVKARAKLSMLTMVNSIEANSIPDSKDNILLFEKAMKKIVNEFNKKSDLLSVDRFKIINMLLSR